jgi:hypothetical protein
VWRIARRPHKFHQPSERGSWFRFSMGGRGTGANISIDFKPYSTYSKDPRSTVWTRTRTHPQWGTLKCILTFPYVLDRIRLSRKKSPLPSTRTNSKHRVHPGITTICHGFSLASDFLIIDSSFGRSQPLRHICPELGITIYLRGNLGPW